MSCTESWATCPAGPPYCYWGDREYNQGRCCTQPGGTECVAPQAPAPTSAPTAAFSTTFAAPFGAPTTAPPSAVATFAPAATAPAATPAPRDTPKPKKKKKKRAAAAPGPGQPGPQIPPFVLDAMGGLDSEQMSTILALIGGPEQSSVRWWEGADGSSVFGYCENIGDGRGVTMGIAGFTSDNPEVSQVLKKAGYDPSDLPDPKKCKKKKKCDFCDWVRAHGTDPRFVAAQWQQYLDEYLEIAVKLVPPQFRGNALILGLLADTAMNSGDGDEGSAWGVSHLARAASGGSPVEWVNSFCDLRAAHFARGNPPEDRKWRLETWRQLAADGKWDLRGVNPCRYAYCYGSKLGDDCRGC
jgi:chitosanase